MSMPIMSSWILPYWEVLGSMKVAEVSTKPPIVKERADIRRPVC